MTPNTHDDVTKWKHFPGYWPLVMEIHRSPVNSPHIGKWRRGLMFSLICAWTTGWVNNRDAGDLSRQCAHYDVTLMLPRISRQLTVSLSAWSVRKSTVEPQPAGSHSNQHMPSCWQRQLHKNWGAVSGLDQIWKLEHILLFSDTCRIYTSWWRNQIEALSASLALCEGNSPVTGEFP